MKIGAIYTRVSTDEQAREGYSLEAQLKDIKKYALNNDILIEPQFIFTDEGVSGRKASKRPAFMEMIKQAKAKKFDVILVHKFDRFSRNREDSIVYKSMLRKECGISVISVSEPLDPDDKMSVIIEAFLEAMAEYYSINLSSEVKKGQLEKHNKGELQTRPCFGYDVQDNKLVINEEQAKVVKMIFEQYALEHLPKMQIAKNVNNLGVRTKSNNKFENRTIYYILNNVTYIGKLRYTQGRKNTYDFEDPNSIIVNGSHEPIIDIDLWNLAQNELTKNNKWKKPKQHIDLEPKHWLKGVVRCKKCGCTMVTNGKTNLRCNGYNKGKCDNHTTLSIDKTYELVINSLKDCLNSETITNIVDKSKPKNNNNQYEIISDKLKQIANKEIRIKEAYQDGIDTLEEYKENKLILQREKERLTNELKNIDKPKEKSDRKKEIIENGKKVYEILSNDKISIKEKNDIINTLIDRIEFDDKTNTLELYFN